MRTEWLSTYDMGHVWHMNACGFSPFLSSVTFWDFDKKKPAAIMRYKLKPEKPDSDGFITTKADGRTYHMKPWPVLDQK